MGHTYSDILVHAVFSTKGRAPAIALEMRERLYPYLAAVARNEVGLAVEIGGTNDHVHMFLLLRTDVSVAEALRKLKTISSGRIHKTFPGASGFGWQSGYSAFSVSESAKAEVVAYIRHQEEHHRRVTFEEELVTLLKEHGIEYDPRYVFD